VTGRSPRAREELASQNATIISVFERAGFEHIAPDIIQPADIFLERSGEDIRARTFVFNDPDGNELCLRPDLTVPACRYHLVYAADVSKARYCYLGQAFRFPDERLSPQEFTQAGIEWFGGDNAIAAEARVIKLAISALEAAGLYGLKVTLGDLGLFNALLEDVAMPEHWRRRLRHQFWRPQAFRELLESFAGGSQFKRSSISETIDRLSGDAAAFVGQELERRDLMLVGGRSIEDVATRLAEKKSDRAEAPLSVESKQMIEAYLAIEGMAPDAAKAMHSLSRNKNFAGALQVFEDRLAALEDAGLNPRRYAFDANFGRDLEYYTGLVFQVEANVGNHNVVVAGGGRYDDLLKDLGAPARIPAVGCAIHTERVRMTLS
jgi:ATP phosphoribosyltransferase regulatory subunit